MPFFEISTTKYNEDIKLIQAVMTKMASSCNITAGFKFGEPTPRFGWTFFQMLIDQELYIEINDEFSDKIKKCKGDKPDEKFINFLSGYFESNDCSAKVKFVKD